MRKAKILKKKFGKFHHYNDFIGFMYDFNDWINYFIGQTRINRATSSSPSGYEHVHC